MGGAWVFPGGAVHADEDADHAATAVRELEEEAGVALAADVELVPFSRWITPERGEGPLRHVVLRGTGATPARGHTETGASAWTLAGFAPPRPWLNTAQDELVLVFPTIKHLELLSEHDSVEATLCGSAGAAVGARDAEGRRPRRSGAGPAARRTGLRRRPSAATNSPPSLLVGLMRRDIADSRDHGTRAAVRCSALPQ